MTDGVRLVQERLPAIQLALFELIWPAFPWIQRIYLDPGPGLCTVVVQSVKSPPPPEWNDCVRLLAETFDALLEDTDVRSAVKLDKAAEIHARYVEAMSEPIFRMIAKDVAPWRLDAGR